MRRRLGTVSLIVIGAALAGSGSFAQTALPTITIGHTHPVTHSDGPGKPVHTHPLYHTHVVPAPRPISPVVAAAPPPAPFEPKAPPPTSSSEKFFTGKQVNALPVARPGEALEIVPGLVVTQHSGEGKANQYFLRGFQLDHGTDLALFLDGMPLNMPTHGHGQGYADANFLMPELLASVTARKGPYSAQDGDFSPAGSVYMQYIDSAPKGGLFSLTGGSFGYGRAFGMKSWEGLGGTFLGAVEAGIYNGPWARPDEIRKINGVLRYSRGTQEDGISVTAMAYANRWFSTDQIPTRAVNAGILSLWDTTDRTDGGDTTRFSLSGRWSATYGNQYSRVEGYAIRQTLDLYNNFTYFLGGHFIDLGDPNNLLDLGDQFHQFDHRTIFGANALHGWKWAIAGMPAETRVGFQGRFDDIRVGLQDSYQRQLYDALRNDYVQEGSVGFWTDTSVQWTPWLKTTGGARFDYFHVDVNSLQTYADAPKVADSAGNVIPLLTGPFNSGSKGAALVSPKAAIVLGPWRKTEFFANYGEGFHSADARGAVQRVDVSGLGDNDGFAQVARTPLLVKARGAEIGVRTKYVEGLDSSLSLFWINLESENQFAGDSGTTVFGRPSRRYGVEFANHYRPTSWISLDADVTMVHARFRGVDQQQTLAALGDPTLGNAPGNYLVNAPEIVALAGLELGEKTGWFGGFKYRYVGVRPLTEDGFLKSPAAGTVNARVGYRWDNGWRLQIDAFNIFNSRSDQITYGYRSRLRNEPVGGVLDRHFKPIEPPAVRVTLGGPLDFTSLPDLGKPLADLGL